MSLPLPLELTKPVPMAADLDGLLASTIGDAKYDPKTQQCWNHGGGGGHNTNSQCVNFGVLNIDDVLQDITIVL